MVPCREAILSAPADTGTVPVISKADCQLPLAYARVTPSLAVSARVRWRQSRLAALLLESKQYTDALALLSDLLHEVKKCALPLPQHCCVSGSKA